MRIIILTEYQTQTLPTAALREEEAKILHQHYGRQIVVEPPSFKTDYHWRLTPQGWVGRLPVTSDLTIVLQPKASLGNLFRMVEYAYDLKSFRLLEGLTECQSVAEFYEQLAHILALRVIERGRKGFYRTYLPRIETLSYVRGRLNIRETVGRPGQAALQCRYEEQTADVEENRILAWTLFTIARSERCSERTTPTIRRAYRLVQGAAALQPPPPDVWVGRVYHRLNEDYRPLHALCRFFLEQSGPSHRWGDRQMSPFLVDMARLYEQFTARWLEAHLPPAFALKIQERVNLSQTNRLHFDIDATLYEAESGLVQAVLDTKYKTPDRPAAADIHQMISYAHTKGCGEAVLIYPAPLAQPFDETIRGIRVRSLTFDLGHNLDKAGEVFLRNLCG